MITNTTTKTESDSLEISRNAKGEYTYSVKVYSDDLKAAETKVADTDKWFRTVFIPSTTKP